MSSARNSIFWRTRRRMMTSSRSRPAGSALAVEHLVANVVLDEALQFLLARRPPPRPRKSVAEVGDPRGGNNDFRGRFCALFAGEAVEREHHCTKREKLDVTALSAAERSRRVTRSARYRRVRWSYRDFRRHLDAEVFCVKGRPARRRNFDHAHIVESPATPRSKSGSFQTVIISPAPIVVGPWSRSQHRQCCRPMSCCGRRRRSCGPTEPTTS